MEAKKCSLHADGYHRTAHENVARCYSHPVRGPDEPEYEPRAHGGTTTTHICRCRAKKMVNNNFSDRLHAEHGEWEQGNSIEEKMIIDIRYATTQLTGIDSCTDDETLIQRLADMTEDRLATIWPDADITVSVACPPAHAGDWGDMNVQIPSDPVSENVAYTRIDELQCRLLVRLRSLLADVHTDWLEGGMCQNTPNKMNEQATADAEEPSYAEC
jgi:hypothetical protein